ENLGKGDIEGGGEREVRWSKDQDSSNVDTTATVKRGRGRPKKVALTLSVAVMASPSAKKRSPPEIARERLRFTKLKRRTGGSEDGSSSRMNQLSDNANLDKDGDGEKDGKDWAANGGRNDWDGVGTRAWSIAGGAEVGIRPGKRKIKLSRKARAAAGVDESSGPQRMTKDMQKIEEKIIAPTHNRKTNKRQT
ncbi:unnamed protein product, partial [Choristocarpus tenellus]